MTELTAFYDGQCGLCSRMRVRLEREPTFLPIRFVALQSPEARRIFPEIERHSPEKEILVLADDGSLYRGEAGWLILFWAMRRYRKLSATLSQPAFRPLLGVACRLISENRYHLSRMLRLGADPNQRELPVGCRAGSCPPPLPIPADHEKA